mgnify:FL=1
MKISAFIKNNWQLKIFITLVALGVFVFGGAAPTNYNAELISIGIDGQSTDVNCDDYYDGGCPAGNSIWDGAVSADGRFVVFVSAADNLTTVDVDGSHVYLRDRENSTTTLVTTGTPLYYFNSHSNAVISADGRYVAYQSINPSLVANDTNESVDIFVYDRLNGSTKRVSVRSDGSEAAFVNYSLILNSHPSISADGRYIAFASYAENLVDGDLPETKDVFVHDTIDGTTTIVSRSIDGNLGNGDSGEPSISADGNSIAFVSRADNLVVNDLNDNQDVFVWRRGSNIERVSIANDGSEANGWSYEPVISVDGRFIAFRSMAKNLTGATDEVLGDDVFLYDSELNSTVILSTGLHPSSRPAISDDGSYVTFTESEQIVTSGSAYFVWELFGFDVGSGQRQLLIENMTTSALSSDGQYLVVAGASSLVQDDPNEYSDVYLLTLDGQPPQEPEICNDGIDNDNDGLTDCNDSADCSNNSACIAPSPETEICHDGIDNDNDGLTDCNDSADCSSNLVCDENIDTDNDGVGNLTDPDDDNDGVADQDDAFPLDATRSVADSGSSSGSLNILYLVIFIAFMGLGRRMRP